MRNLACFALTIGGTAAWLAGCSGSQPPIGTLGTMPQTTASAVHVERDGSWMLPQATSKDLLYVTNYSTALVFTYPEGSLVGTLKGFRSAVGACVDSKGDVYIVNFNPLVVYEYAHGSTKRIATYVDKKAGSVGCAINPVNGDLAVTGVSSFVDMFKAGSQKPTSIKDKQMWYGSFDTYDNEGNLYFLGLRNAKGLPRLSELPSGSVKFVTLEPDAPVYDEGGIQWDDGYLTAASWIPFKGDRRKVAIYQFQITGRTAHKVSDIPLNKPAYIVLQYFIDGNILVVPNLEAKGSNVLLYRYPVGGQPTSTLTKHITDARGVVVSRATR